MSAATTKVLASAAGVPLCDVAVIGVKPGAGLYIDWTGTTIASFLLVLELAKHEAMKAWEEGKRLEFGKEDAA